MSSIPLALVPAGKTSQTPLLNQFPPRAVGAGLRVRLGTGEERRLDGPMRVGSGPDNDWVLFDPYVSSEHLMLVADGPFVRLADRGSRNGTFVNGTRVEKAILGPGASVTIGESQLQVLCDGETQLYGEGSAMRAVRTEIARLGPLPLSVLVLGESGTGKELAARSLHERSGRRGPLIAVNCGALPRDLIESELFGHEKGAFTGAQKKRPGCFVEANGGTLFLDEIGELPLDLQPRLLRALEVRAVRPVGGEREVPVDVRIVSATHRDLRQAVREGRFREDLYYRLQAVELVLPPLRQRPEDVPGLVRLFLMELSGSTGAVHIDDQELALLSRHPWPGNVRQLRHAVQRAAHLCGPRLRAEDILPALPAIAWKDEGAAPAGGLRYAELQREAFLSALRQTGHNRRAAAALLGIPKSTLCDRLRRLGL